MKSDIAENIKNLRKEKKFTQEQLAEAMGVSVGAVSKWESGASVPELGLIMELADFFETSVDALLGYRMQDNSIKNTVDRINTFYSEKKFEEGIFEVEKALQKYPNNFDIVYRASTFFYFWGTEKHDKKYLMRAKELLERSLNLIDQPHDIKSGKSEIYNDLAGIYFMIGNEDKGIEILKEHNESGIFDAFIGYYLAAFFKKYDEALPYLSDFIVMSLTGLFYNALGLANLYAGKGDFDLALDAVISVKNFYDSFRIPGKASYLDKSKVILTVACAQICEDMNDP
ncbi:MAG: helix-turn-helix transcriptional regulator, partial [Oscillospiraceae bacterium]|nr:helix-turn-helix transcriptional regulator [Oscillospiraceae bacterium]